jgi:hypothetical protein
MTTSASPPMPRKRHPMIAFAAGVIAPGLGLWITGRAIAGLSVALLSLAITLLLPVLVVDGVFGDVALLPSIVLAASATVRFGSAAIAAVLAFTDGPRVFRPSEHPWWALGFLLVTFFGSVKLRDEVAFAHVAAVDAPLNTALRPDIAEDQYLVVVKRGFDPAAVALNELVAVRGGSPSFPRDPAQPEGTRARRGFARVIARAGSVVEVKDDGGVVVDGFPVVAAPCPATVPHGGLVCTEERQATTTGEARRRTTATSIPRAFPPTSVGPGQVFVLPDDRGRQLRAPAGLVAVTDLEGRVVPSRRR